MSIYKIDSNSTREEIVDFYHLYVEGFDDLCMWKGQKIINLGDFIQPTREIETFTEDVKYTTKGIGFIIYYTHNDDVITSIAFVDVDNMANCFVKITYLCGNQSTKDEKINGKTQGINMLDFIFTSYKDYIILIEPATPGLISYYTKYKKPCFPYDKAGLQETFNYLVYGNLRKLPEICFTNIFRSMKYIDSLVKLLKFSSINDLYSKTHNINSLERKIFTKLDFLVKTKEVDPHYYEQIIDKITGIQYYDIQDIIMKSIKFERNVESHTISSRYEVHGGVKKSRKHKRKNKKNTRYNRNKK